MGERGVCYAVCGAIFWNAGRGAFSLERYDTTLLRLLLLSGMHGKGWMGFLVL
jgi:hypothetical protein